jgi:putative spermidine/putrescine transport system substrate-binding protein
MKRDEADIRRENAACYRAMARREFLERMGWGLGGGVLLGTGLAPFRDRLEARERLPGPLNLYTIPALFGRDQDLNKFREKYDVDIKVTAWVNNPGAATKLATGGTKLFDLTMMVHSFVKPLAIRNLLEPIDPAQIPNYAHLWPQFVNFPPYMYEGKLYGSPHIFGYDTILYNAKFLSEVDSYGILFDEKLKGKIGMRDDPFWSIASFALYLGYENPWLLSKEDLDKIKEFTISKKHLIRKFWKGFSEAVTLFKNEEIWVSVGWRPMWRVLRNSGLDIRTIFPKEKAMGFLHAYIVSKGTKVMPTVYQYLDWVLGDEYGYAMVRDHAYYSPSKLVMSKLSEEEIKEMGYDRFNDVMTNVVMADYPFNLEDWHAMWNEYKSA